MTTETTNRQLPEGLDRLPPRGDDLPYDDDQKMESQQHVLQMFLLIAALQRAWEGVRDVFVGGNMFVYFSPDQVLTHDFRGPDVFVALDVPPGPRKRWVVWEEGGKAPDVVIELLSDTTAAKDKGEKMLVYQDRLRVPEYFWFDPLGDDFAGFALQDGIYEPITPDAPARLPSRRLGLSLVVWEGVYGGVHNRWLRWATSDGTLLPTAEEAAEEERRRAEELVARLARYRERFGDLPQ